MSFILVDRDGWIESDLTGFRGHKSNVGLGLSSGKGFVQGDVQQPAFGRSSRNASTGSTRAARLAGMKAAAMTATSRKTDSVARTAGSGGLTPASRNASAWPAAMLTANPTPFRDIRFRDQALRPETLQRGVRCSGPQHNHPSLRSSISCRMA